MTATRAAPAIFAPDTAPAAFDAIGDAMATSHAYAETAIRFAEVRDSKGLAYAIRCASAALLSAAALLEEVRPSRTGAGR